ncbi:hypothetical protein T440DRAFT_222596 [Plenodomus tracheiphilus IPT5]|uniref:Uncharacterized protein n=1 Tax=Plenodomus tracheiphilus IPT5 TaxID=1408161 RepID=A0A6A7AUK0_9PLEO|nr:hypothetical protein T440DRAFT_222596 [Plenodomus tracheiphilus IPT5]
MLKSLLSLFRRCRGIPFPQLGIIVPGFLHGWELQGRLQCLEPSTSALIAILKSEGMHERSSEQRMKGAHIDCLQSAAKLQPTSISISTARKNSLNSLIYLFCTQSYQSQDPAQWAFFTLAASNMCTSCVRPTDRLPSIPGIQEPPSLPGKTVLVL